MVTDGGDERTRNVHRSIYLHIFYIYPLPVILAVLKSVHTRKNQSTLKERKKGALTNKMFVRAAECLHHGHQSRSRLYLARVGLT